MGIFSAFNARTRVVPAGSQADRPAPKKDPKGNGRVFPIDVEPDAPLAAVRNAWGQSRSEQVWEQVKGAVKQQVRRS